MAYRYPSELGDIRGWDDWSTKRRGIVLSMVHRGHSVRTRQAEARPSRPAQMKWCLFVAIAVLIRPESSVTSEVRARRKDVVYLSETRQINQQSGVV